MSAVDHPLEGPVVLRAQKGRSGGMKGRFSVVVIWASLENSVMWGEVSVDTVRLGQRWLELWDPLTCGFSSSAP